MKKKETIKNLTYLLTETGDIDTGENVDPLDESNFVQTREKLNPFDFVNAINFSKVDLFPPDESNSIRESHSDSEYPKFIINKSLSYFADTILFANLANMHLNNVPNMNHFDFYRLSIPRKKRFSKWAKRVISPDVKMLADYYNCSYGKAIEYCNVLTSEQINDIRKITDHGGIK